MSGTDRPKANNKNVLRPYSASTKHLQRRGKYNHGSRPSGHYLGQETFLKDNGGSIVPSVLEVEPIDPGADARLLSNVFSIAHTNSNDRYLRKCKEENVEPHPARMPLQLADFFIQFLTEPGDLVLDPFAGSNATGYCAHQSARHWIGIEANPDYAIHSKLRFSDETIESQ
jgi:DNA modification methylase